ncbi:MAG TPA: UDP-N-acetylmuramoyl-L-alanine--D-glutamate ligase [Pontiella sp.]|nr:UDP-N-acetylmuramoyl-L-alanine--D-glutamate ligase [Pontiella sp.]
MKTCRTALILGYGRSGQAAERMLQAEGTETFVLTRESSGDAAVADVLRHRRFDVCIVSPGFGLSHPWLRAVRDAGIPLLAELELGWSRHKGRTAAVTGSNGKSTAVKWLCETLRQAGYETAIGGNYGVPACEVVMEHPDLDWLVLEVSSFQLETVIDFRADAAIVLNVFPNHLDRHENMEVYRRTKARIFGSLSEAGDACMVPVELLDLFRRDVGTDRNWVTFGKTPDADFHYDGGAVVHDAETILDLSGTVFDNPIIGGCTGAAIAAFCAVFGVPPSAAEAAARAFQPLPHRLERLGELNGILFVNDSKATNLAATAAALEACGNGIHLIAGGLPKESDYTFVKEKLAERVRSIYLIGQASRAMYAAWNGVCPCIECGTLEEAFSTAENAAGSGEIILLSPGCASFDQFRSFEERGDRFAALFRDAVQAGGDAS